MANLTAPKPIDIPFYKLTQPPTLPSNVIYFHEADKGGHFAAWEEPELFSAELRAAFRSLREAR